MIIEQAKNSPNINSHFETIIGLKWIIMNLRIMNIKQLECIYNVGWPEDIGRGRAGGLFVL